MANVNARRVEEILTSGITAGHYVAGSNITITENQDGTETIASTGGGGGGTTDYSDLTNKPSINNVTLSGNKTTSDLGIDEVPDVTSSDDGKILKASYSENTGTYNWANISNTDIINVLSAAQQNAINSGITSNKVSTLNTISGQMETFYPKLLDVGTNVGEITAQDLDNLSFGIYEYLGMFTGSTLPTELAYKTGVVRGYFTQESMAWNVQFQMVETTDGIFGARIYQGNGTWSNWTFNVPGGGGTAPTAYTETLTGRTWTIGSESYKSVISDGGFVVTNNICTFNIYVTFTITGGTLVTIPSSNQTIIYGFPKPCSTGPVPKFIGINNDASSGNSLGLFRCSIDTNGDLHVEFTSQAFRASGFYLTGSYLIDTST